MINDRTEFNKLALEVLDFVDTYEIVKYEHLEKFYPNNKKIVDYLIKEQRLFRSEDNIYIGTEQNAIPSNQNKQLITSLSVLADVLTQVKSYTKAAPPVQISFITHNGDYYEIIYVAYGMEIIRMQSRAGRQASDQAMNTLFEGKTKRIIIVEDKGQMEKLAIPETVRFALVSPNGELSYFKGS